jgi:hypothetical protein
MALLIVKLQILEAIFQVIDFTFKTMKEVTNFKSKNPFC